MATENANNSLHRSNFTAEKSMQRRALACNNDQEELSPIQQKYTDTTDELLIYKLAKVLQHRRRLTHPDPK